MARTVYGLDITLRLTDGKLTAVALDSVDASKTELTLSVRHTSACPSSPSSPRDVM